MTESEFIQIIKEQYKDKSGVIGISGLSGSGKTTLAKKLRNYFPNRSLIVSFDDFCIAPTNLRKSFLQDALDKKDFKKLQDLVDPIDKTQNPYANLLTWYDWRAIANTIEDLKRGISVTRNNTWDQKTGECNKVVTYEVPSNKPLLLYLDCIYMYEPVIASHIDLTVMIDLAKDIANQREFDRDKHRNCDMYHEYKELVTQKYCIPYLNHYKNQTDYFIN